MYSQFKLEIIDFFSCKDILWWLFVIWLICIPLSTAASSVLMFSCFIVIIHRLIKIKLYSNVESLIFSKKFLYISCLPLLVFIYLSVTFSFTSASPSSAWSYLSKYFELAIFPIFTYGFLTIKKKYRLKLIVAFLLSVFILSFVLLVYQIYLIYSDVSGVYSYAFDGYIDKHRIKFGTVSALAAGISFFYFKEKSAPLKISRFSFVWFVFSVVFLNHGRTGIFVFICLSLCLVASFGVNLKRLKSIIPTSLLIILLLYFVPNPIASEIHDAFGEINFYSEVINEKNIERLLHSSLLLRFEFSKTGWSSFLLSPLFGNGVGSIPLMFNTVSPYSDYIDCGNFHIAFLNTLSQFGVFGFLLFSVFYISLIRYSKSLDNFYRRILLCVIIWISIHSFVNSFYIDSYCGYLHLILLSLFVSLIPSDDEITLHFSESH